MICRRFPPAPLVVTVRLVSPPGTPPETCVVSNSRTCSDSLDGLATSAVTWEDKGVPSDRVTTGSGSVPDPVSWT